MRYKIRLLSTWRGIFKLLFSLAPFFFFHLDSKSGCERVRFFQYLKNKATDKIHPSVEREQIETPKPLSEEVFSFCFLSLVIKESFRKRFCGIPNSHSQSHAQRLRRPNQSSKAGRNRDGWETVRLTGVQCRGRYFFLSPLWSSFWLLHRSDVAFCPLFVLRLGSK